MKKILFVYPNPFRYSETFVRNHLDGVKPDFTLTGGWYPYIDNNGISIFSQSILGFNLIRAFVKRVFPSLYHRLYQNALTKFMLNKGITNCFAEYGVTSCSIMYSCEELNIPFTTHFHGFDAFEFKYTTEYGERYKHLFRIAKHIVSVSLDMNDKLVQLGADRNKITTIPCGVDTNRFVPGSMEKISKRIIYVGRFTEKKSPINLLKAFNIVAKKDSGTSLQMIGDGELFEQAKAFIAENELTNQVILEGVMKPDEIISHLQKAEIFVQHSMFSKSTGDSEGTPGTVLEASSCGLPVVSTRHAGIKQAVIEGETGFLVDEGDFQAMAEKILWLINNPDEGKRFGAAGRIHITENYELNLQLRKLKNLIES